MATPRRMRRFWDWLVRDRRTGKVVIAQLPNAPLAVFLAATVVLRLVDPAGDARNALRFVAVGALLWWSIDEVLRGVNPFRRLLGGVVLAATVAGLVDR